MPIEMSCSVTKHRLATCSQGLQLLVGKRTLIGCVARGLDDNWCGLDVGQPAGTMDW